MLKMNLKRVAGTHNGTYGVLMIAHKEPFGLTYELPWLFNERGVSCIPGNRSYICHRYTSPNFGEVFQVLNVPERTNILFHKGNTKKDTKGCIIVGEQFEQLGEEFGVLRSGKGFQEFMHILDDTDKFELAITDPLQLPLG